MAQVPLAAPRSKQSHLQPLQNLLDATAVLPITGSTYFMQQQQCPYR
jgi:hypothetical protein